MIVTASALFSVANAALVVDTTFSVDANSHIREARALSDGKILIAGDFTRLNNTPRNYIARIDDNGTLDPSFDPNPNNIATIKAILPDDKVLVVGFLQRDSWRNVAWKWLRSICSIKSGWLFQSIF